MKKITNYILSVLLSGSLLSASLFYTAQTTSAASDKTTKEKTKITFMESGTGNYADVRKQSLEAQLLDDFPDIEIIVEAYPEEQYYSILNTRLSMGEGPDFFNIQPNWAGPNAVQKLAPAGYLEPLDDLAVIQNADEADTESVTWNGHTYSLNRFSMILCTYYNKSIFEKLGLSIPQNWAEFLNMCEKLKNAGITPVISGNKDSYALQFGLYQIAANQVYSKSPDFNAQLADGNSFLFRPWHLG